MVIEHAKAPGIDGMTCPNERRKEIRKASSAVDDPRDLAVTYKIATTREELENAYSLVWDNYVETGFEADDHSKLRLTKYNLLPDTRVFVAKYKKGLINEPKIYDEEGICIGTVTIVFDGPMGLPIEEVCPDDISRLRSEGKKLAEVVGFAVNREYTNYKEFLYIFKVLFQYASLVGVTDLCCTVTKRHSRFYRKVCFFEPLGELVEYKSAGSVQAQGHLLNLERAKLVSKEVYSGREFDADLHRFFFGGTYNDSLGNPLSGQDLDYFISKKSNFKDNLEEKDLQILRSAYQEIGHDFPY
ncbi:N-acyl amino acid synthase FeeM domain-containing protein [Vibrio algarum]|uniref:N-acyl amino acid synthase FeeM catalytic core domain-containing protein n=1 Tax=Vibrio algarum TaxID=3020714 RepID=A0ABT4YQ65_9VIBR|nr:hypothetical protein [Vibrio sp. KJ40-1]MDB1123699.1 hypothetical protein [Vibrio sp. KJ40-1]